MPLALMILALSANFASAQCTGPDNLSGPCCSATTPILPNFQAFQLPGTAICWNSCVAQPQEVNGISVGVPVATSCTSFIAPISITNGAGVVYYTGSLVMDYTRTWEELKPTNPPAPIQAYRFVVKIDLLPTGAGGTACNTPACIPSENSAFYYGYMDYVYECGTILQDNVLVLFHNCDLFVHQPSISAKPGVYHPSSTHALVWPSTTASPFVATNVVAPGGALVGEATRLNGGIPGLACVTEDPISSGIISPVGGGCACPLSSGPLQNTVRHMDGKGTCPDTAGMVGSFASLNVTPTFPWFEVIASSIGAWTGPLTYPGLEHAWVDEGVFLVRDACSDVLLGKRKFIEINYGGSTSGGFPVIPSLVNPTITSNMTDMADNKTIPRPGPITFPFVGCVLPTRGVTYVNF